MKPVEEVVGFYFRGLMVFELNTVAVHQEWPFGRCFTFGQEAHMCIWLLEDIDLMKEFLQKCKEYYEATPADRLFMENWEVVIN